MSVIDESQRQRSKTVKYFIKYLIFSILPPVKKHSSPHLQRPIDAETNAMHSVPGGTIYAIYYITANGQSQYISLAVVIIISRHAHKKVKLHKNIIENEETIENY
jgi:hypothetical protein